MKKYRKIMIGVYIAIFVLFCVFGATRSVKRTIRTDVDIMNADRIFDDAGLFSSDEKEKLSKQLKRVMKSEKTDIAIVTTNNTNGKTAEEYAEEFYTSHGFGYEKEKGTGVLLLIDMDTSITGKRKIWISGCGEAKTYINNNICTKISNEIKEDCANGKYYSASSSFLKKAKSYMNQSSSIPKFLSSWVWRFLIAAIGTAAFVFFKVKTFGMKVTTTSGTYLKEGSVVTNSRGDDFLGTTVTTRIIKHDDDSNSGGGYDGGGDSGGSDFSGGGADF